MSQEPTLGRAQDIIMSSDGNPFATDQKARKHAEATKLDADVYGVRAYENGFAIVRKASGIWQALDLADAAAQQKAGGEPVAEKYLYVKFHAMRDVSDTVNVEQGVNCVTLIFQREVKTICPERYINALRDARTPLFEVRPGQPRKVIGYQLTYPFDILPGESSREEFEKERREGTERTRARFIGAESAPALV